MKAVIFCDDSTFAAKARSLLRRVGNRPGVNVRWTVKAWPVNALHHASLSETALLNAADAHLVVLPANHARALSSHLRGWLNRWAALRDIEEAAVGVIGDNESSGSSETDEVSLELRLLVQRHGLNLIHDEAPKPPAKLEVRFPLEGEHPLRIQLSHFRGDFGSASRSRAAANAISARTCPHCFLVAPSSVEVCDNCGHRFAQVRAAPSGNR